MFPCLQSLFHQYMPFLGFLRLSLHILLHICRQETVYNPLLSQNSVFCILYREASTSSR